MIPAKTPRPDQQTPDQTPGPEDPQATATVTVRIKAIPAVTLPIAPQNLMGEEAVTVNKALAAGENPMNVLLAVAVRAAVRATKRATIQATKALPPQAEYRTTEMVEMEAGLQNLDKLPLTPEDQENP